VVLNNLLKNQLSLQRKILKNLKQKTRNGLQKLLNKKTKLKKP